MRTAGNPGTGEMLPAEAFRDRSAPSGARSITPRVFRFGHAEKCPRRVGRPSHEGPAAGSRSGRPTLESDGVQETGGAAGWPVLRAADGLSQRSLRSLLDSRRTPSFAPPPRGPAKSTTAVVDCRGCRAVGPTTTVAVKPQRAAMTRTDARRCWSTQRRLREEKSRVRVASAERSVQLRTTRRASAARSAWSRSRSLSP